MEIVAAEYLEALRKVDSPTLSNAIERLEVRSRTQGYAGFDLKCILPELGTMLGHAVTCTADSLTEDRRDQGGYLRLWAALESAPKPAVLVIQDIGANAVRSCHFGEVMATIAKALGAVGCVCSGGVRDVLEIKKLGGFHLFSPGFVVSHGRPVICDVGVPVSFSGIEISPGDLLHGDVNGLLTVPPGISNRLIEAVESVRREEKVILDAAAEPGFSVEKLRRLREGLKH